jgi:enoyl-CoA hydratase/carnithine racemase
MRLILVEQCDGATVVRLHRGVTNALDLQCVNDLAEVVGEARSDPDVRSLVLTSANDKFFSIGFDIPQLVALGRDEFRHFFRTFNRVCLDLYTLPKPTVAAITGHAIAGGCILALCCDYRLIAEGRKLMGLNEVKLGLPVPYPADCMLRSLIGSRHAREVMESGEFYLPEASLGMGMVDQVLALEQVVERAVEKAVGLGSLPAVAYGMIKRNRVEVVEAEILAQQEEKERLFLDCWTSEEARRRLREAAEKF